MRRALTATTALVAILGSCSIIAAVSVAASVSSAPATAAIHSPPFLLLDLPWPTAASVSSAGIPDAALASSSTPSLLRISPATESSCDKALASAQRAFGAAQFTLAESLIDGCIAALQEAVGVPSYEVLGDRATRELWASHPALKAWTRCFQFRALARWKAGKLGPASDAAEAAASDDGGAPADIALALALTPNAANPDLHQIAAGIHAAREDYLRAVASLTAEVIVRLGFVSASTEAAAEQRGARFLADAGCTAAVGSAAQMNCTLGGIVSAVEQRLYPAAAASAAASGSASAPFALRQTKDVEALWSPAVLGPVVRSVRGLVHFASLTSPAAFEAELVLQSQRLLSLLLPSDAALHALLSTKLFGQGDLLRGLHHSMLDMNLQLHAALVAEAALDAEQTEREAAEAVARDGIFLRPPAALPPPSMEETWDELHRNSALLFLAGMESHVTNLARSILAHSATTLHADRSSPNPSIVQIARNCNVSFCGVLAAPAAAAAAAAEAPTAAPSSSNPFFGLSRCDSELRQDMLSHILSQCIRQQDLFARILAPPTAAAPAAESASASASASAKGLLSMTNEFGFNGLHELALFGDVALLREALAIQPVLPPAPQASKQSKKKQLQSADAEAAASLRVGVNLNAMSHMGWSSLHFAAARGNEPMVAFLLSPSLRDGDAAATTTAAAAEAEGINPLLLDFKERTALEVACIHAPLRGPLGLRVAQLIDTAQRLAQQAKNGDDEDEPDYAPAAPKSLQQIQALCTQLRAAFSPLDQPLLAAPDASSAPPPFAPMGGCTHFGGWSPYLVSTSGPPFECSQRLAGSGVAKLSFVSAADEARLAREKMDARRARGWHTGQGKRAAAASVAEGDEFPLSEASIPAASPLRALYAPRCDLPILSPPASYSAFVSDILAMQRPVLIRGAMDWRTLEWADAFHALTREQLLSKHGAIKLSKANIPYAAAFGLNASDVRLRDFASYMTELAREDAASLRDGDLDAAWTDPARLRSLGQRDYVFLSLPIDGAAQSQAVSDPESPAVLAALFAPPHWLSPSDDELGRNEASEAKGVLDPTMHRLLSVRKLQWFLGPRFSGAPQHFHRSAINLQTFGRKRWSIRPPASAVYSKRGSLEAWLEDAAAADAASDAAADRGERALECIQESGDIVFVPDSWSHATINLEESVGFAAELLWGATHFSL